MNRSMALVLVGALMTLAGCGTSSGGSQEPSGAIVASNPTTPSPTPTVWPSMVDRRTGVRFSLPHRKKAVRAPHAQPPTWVYAAPVPDGARNDDKLNVAVAFFDGGIPSLPTTLDNLAAAAKQAGMEDAKRSGLHPTKVDGKPAQTATLTFTAANGQVAYWATTEFAVGRYPVTAQVYSLSDPSELDARTKQVKQLMQQLLASIKLP